MNKLLIIEQFFTENFIIESKLEIIEHFFTENFIIESKIKIIEHFFTENSFESKLEIIPERVWVWLLLLFGSP